MRAWAFMLGGMIVWTVHFFAVYIAGSVFPNMATARVLTGLITLACLAAAAVLFVLALRCPAGLARTLSAAGAALAAVSIVWQGLPALFA